MTAVADLIHEAHKDGVKFILPAPGTVKLIGKEPVVQRWFTALRQHKQAIIEALERAVYEATLVDELIESDGISREEAEAIAKSAAYPYPPEKWMAMIADLDSLIEEYCKMVGVNQEKVLTLRSRQSLASIPETLSWFQDEVSRMRRSSDGQP